MFPDVKPVSLADIQAAHRRLEKIALRTPLVRCDATAAGRDLWLKLENLQEIGSFKVRPIGNAVLSREHKALERGIYTSSSGNSALGVAWMASKLGIQATAVVPDNAPQAKLAGLRKLGANIIVLPYEQWWRVIETGQHDGLEGLYVDAVRDPASLAGDGTIGIEIAENGAEIDAVFIPFGGGGLACGIACALKVLRPSVKIVACELTSARPLQAAFAAGGPVPVDAAPGFVSGIGYGQVLPEMWPLLSSLVDEVVTITLDEVKAAIRVLVDTNHVVAEGAGAVSVAAALYGAHSHRRVCAVVSGGNLDPALLAEFVMSDRSVSR
jgi:threonine dehydratase